MAVLWLALTVAALGIGIALRPEALRIVCLCVATVGLRMALVHLWPGTHGRPDDEAGSEAPSAARMRLRGVITGDRAAEAARGIAAVLTSRTSQVCIDLRAVTLLHDDGAQELGTTIFDAGQRGVPTLISGAAPHVRSALHRVELGPLATFRDDSPA
ncbi:hypothetical protein ACIA9I_34410 [Streptomyces anulatus]